MHGTGEKSKNILPLIGFKPLHLGVNYTNYAVPVPALFYEDFKTQEKGLVCPEVLQACILRNGRGRRLSRPVGEVTQII